MSPEKMTVDEIKRAMDCRESPCSEVSLKNCRDCFMKEREDHEKEQEAREAAEARAEDLKEKNKVLKGEKVVMKIRIDRLMATTKKQDRKVYKAQGEEKDAKRQMNEAMDEVKRWQHKVEYRDTVIEGNENIIEKKNKEIETLKKALKIKDEEAAKAIKNKDKDYEELELAAKQDASASQIEIEDLEKQLEVERADHQEELALWQNRMIQRTDELNADLKKVRKEKDEVKRIGRGYLTAIEGLTEKVLELEKETKPKKAKKKRRSWFSRR